MDTIAWFADISIDDVADVGGKNASLGEMYSELAAAGVRVPNGFATTSASFRHFLAENRLDAAIATEIAGWDRENVTDLEHRTRRIRSMILSAELPTELVADVELAYAKLSSEAGPGDVHCAVRSSATAEDLPEASFAGQQETYLMVHGIADVLAAIRRCYASLYTARAVSYREHMGIDQTDIALSACVQRMVRSDLASSGVLFTLDTDSGHRGVVYLTASWGLGENIVQGRVLPDAFVVHKACLRAGFDPVVSKSLGAKELWMRYDAASNRVVNDRTSDEDRRRFCLDEQEVLDLARWALVVETHYSRKRGVDTPMDIEWAKDGETGELFIVQARPETVHSQRKGTAMQVFALTDTAPRLAEGLAIGDRAATGAVHRIEDPAHMDALVEGEVLVTDTTDPDWEPVLKRASALVTARGGRTSHAAIVARELGIPAIVGAGASAEALTNGTTVTVSCTEGEVGVVYDGAVPFTITDLDPARLPTPRTDVMLNVGDPSQALKHSLLPSAGVGLARMEFIFASYVGVHPLAVTRPETLAPAVRRQVDALTAGHANGPDYVVDRLAQGIGTIAAAFWPRPVIVRFSDFKTNEYAGLLGGAAFEPDEPNPMLGWRGASRYYDPGYRYGFELELLSVRRVRETFGLTNLKVMVPFCRTPEEGRSVLNVMAEQGIRSGEDGLEVYVMAELPANIFLAPEFAQVFDGFSIGSNDLTQLILGVDRDSESVARLFDEQNEAVKRACAHVIDAAHDAGRKIGICGQAPSDHPEFAAFLVREGIDSISVTPDALARTLETVSAAERAIDSQGAST
jgi:pyruvate,water dikinase